MPRHWPRRTTRSPISSERPARPSQLPAEAPMRGNTMAWGVAAAVTALTMTLGGCTSKGAEADEAQSSTSSKGAAAAAPAGDTGAVRPVVVPSEQLERLHVDPVVQTSF